MVIAGFLFLVAILLSSQVTIPVTLALIGIALLMYGLYGDRDD